MVKDNSEDKLKINPSRVTVDVSENDDTIFEDSKMMMVQRNRATGEITLELHGKIVSGDPNGDHVVRFGDGVWEIHGTEWLREGVRKFKERAAIKALSCG